MLDITTGGAEDRNRGQAPPAHPEETTIDTPARPDDSPLRAAFEHVIDQAANGALDMFATPPRPRLAQLTDEELLDLCHACHQLATLASVVEGWARERLAALHPVGWALVSPAAGTVKVGTKAPPAPKHLVEEVITRVLCEVAGASTESGAPVDPLELPAAFRAIGSRLGRLFGPSAKVLLTEADAQGIPRTLFVRAAPTSTEDLLAPVVTYTPPKSTNPERPTP